MNRNTLQHQIENSVPLAAFERDNVIYSWPLNNTGLNCAVPLIHRFFSILIYSWPSVSLGFKFVDSTNHRPVFSIPQLGICGCGGLTIYIVLGHLIKGVEASVSFGSPRCTRTNPLQIVRDDWVCGKSKVTHGFQTTQRGIPPYPHIVSRSTVYLYITNAWFAWHILMW